MRGGRGPKGNYSEALRPFLRGTAPPYRVGQVVVTSAKAKTTHGRSAGFSPYHLVESVAAAWDPTVGLILGARWVCGGGSTGAIVAEPEDELSPSWTVADLTCRKCLAVRDGQAGPCVYRVYDASRTRLLYIGSTKNWAKRRTQHQSSTWWWRLAREWDLEFYPTIREARRAEAAAIKAERPQMNVAHNRESA